VSATKDTTPRRLVWSAACAVLALGALAAPASAQNWPSFRGPDASGVAPSPADVPIEWNLDTSRHVAWRTPIPGLAHSSPIVWGDRIYVTTAVASSGKPGVTTGDSSKAGIDAASDMVAHTWRLLAIDKQSGRIVWNTVAHQGVPRLKRHVKASHASSTPATDGRVIVALLGSEGLFCFDMSGALKWRKDLGVLDVGLVDDPTYQWGPASSPVIDRDLVIVQNDRHKDSFLAAYALADGREVWRAARDEMPSWATPLVFHGRGRSEIVTNSPKAIRGYDPASGRELWRMSDDDTQVKVPTPVAAGEIIVVTGGYPSGGRPIYGIRSGGSGTLDRRALAWRAERGSPYTGTPIVYDGLLYICTDNGILSAFDAATGARLYQQRLSPDAGAFSASPVAAAGRIYLTGEDGTIFVVKAGRTFELLASNRMNSVLMATPAISGNLLIVRTLTDLVGIRS